VKQNEPVVPRGPTKPKNKNHPTTDSSAAKRAKKEPHNDVPNTYTFDASQQPAAPESASLLDRLMDPAIFGTMNMPDVHAEEPAYDSAVWFNERQMETAESLYNSMINHTSPPVESMSYLPEPHASDMVTHSIETAVPAEYANTERNLALEAMATAADALLDPALLEEPIREMDMAPSPNFEAVEGKVVPWGSVSSGDDQEPAMNGWHISGTEDQSSDVHNDSQAVANDDHQRGREDNCIHREANDEPSLEVEEPQHAPFQMTEAREQDMQLQQPSSPPPQEMLEQDVQMVDADPLPEKGNNDFPEDQPEQLKSESTESVELMEVDVEAEAAPVATALEVQPPSALLSEVPASPVLANGIISPITPRAISLEVDIPATPANNVVLTSTESAHSKRQSARQSKPIDRFTVETVTKHMEKKPTPITNGAVKSTSPQSVRKPARSKTPAKTPIKPKAIKPEVPQESPLADTATVPEADEDTMKLIEQMRQEDLGLRRRRAS
jgi:hypothetical protein